MELTKGINKVRNVIASKIRTLQAFSRVAKDFSLSFHLLIIRSLVPSSLWIPTGNWQLNSFTNKILGLAFQQSAIQLFELYEEEFFQYGTDNCLDRARDAELSLVNLISAVTDGDRESVKWVKDCLYRLCRSSLVDGSLLWMQGRSKEVAILSFASFA